MEKSSAQNSLKMVVITDAHMGPNSLTRPGEEAPGLLKEFVREVNKNIDSDLVVDLGDRINNQSRQADEENTIQYFSIMDKLKPNYFPILGNHDLYHLGRGQIDKLLGRSAKRRAQSLHGYRLIFLDTQQPVIDGVGGNVSGEQLDWLKEEINCNKSPKIVFGHHPLDNQNVSRNPHFTESPSLAFVKNKREVQGIITEGENVTAYLNGHLHWSCFRLENGFPFVSLPSFTEAWPKEQDAPGTFAEVEFQNGNLLAVTLRSLNSGKIEGKFSLGAKT